jgi:hypothetical protein
LSARDGIGMRQGQLDHREDWVELAELWGQSKVVCAMANTDFNSKRGLRPCLIAIISWIVGQIVARL